VSQRLVRLDRTEHAALRVDDEAALSVCAKLNMVPVVLSEIPRLVIQYPLLFTKNAETQEFICIALLSLGADENYFWVDGRWNSGCVPLNLGRQPFYVGQVDPPRNDQGNFMMCIDLESPGIKSVSGEALFDAQGNETPYLKHKLQILGELLEFEPRTTQFIARLRELDLIQPLHLELRRNDSQKHQITGLFSIDERKLRSLDAATLAELRASNYLHAIYASLSSLGHLHLFARRQQQPAKSA
jgi:hypothetical protein